MEITCSFEREIAQLKTKLFAQERQNATLMDNLIQLKNELSISKNQYKEFYDYNSSIYFIIDKNYRIQSLNFQASFLLGIQHNLIPKQSFFNFLTCDAQIKLEKAIQTLIHTQCKQICEVKLVQKGGKVSYVVIESSLLENKLIRLCLKDMTSHHQLKLQNSELKKSLNLVTNLFHETTDAIAALDEKFYIKILNQSFVELFSKIFAVKIEVNTNLLLSIADFLELKNKIIKASDAAFIGDKTTFIVENKTRKHEAYYCYELCFSSIYDKKIIIFQIKNLSKYKWEEQKQRRQQATVANVGQTNAIVELTAALAHELNQPLAAIAIYSRGCQLMLDNYKNNHYLKKLLSPLEQIALHTKHAGDIIHRMKNYLHEEVFYAELTDVNLLIREALSLLDYEWVECKLNINFYLMDNLPLIKIDRVQIMQVILNLARNSIEALQSTSNDKPELCVETQIQNKMIFVHFKDNGPGIPKENQDKILNSYFTTKPQGTGLGLAICRTLIAAHGGTLRVNTKKNGAWLSFSLPIT